MTKITHSGPGIGFLDSRYVNVTGDTMTGDLNLQDDVNLYFDTAKSVGLVYSTDHSEILLRGGNLSATGQLYFSSNTAADGSGEWEPYIRLLVDGSAVVQNVAQGDAADRHLDLNFADSVRITAGGLHLQTSGSLKAIIEADNIATSDKTFQFPNASGTFLISDKVKITSIGGMAVKLTNKTGANTVAGQTVKADTSNDDAFILTAADDPECIGVVLDAGVADASEAWVVVSGIADVAMEDNTAATRGNWVQTSEAEAGYADATDTSPQAAPQHFNEIGHCIESVAAGGGGTHILARCVLHFN